jgi:hypothetical protein
MEIYGGLQEATLPGFAFDFLGTDALVFSIDTYSTFFKEA